MGLGLWFLITQWSCISHLLSHLVYMKIVLTVGSRLVCVRLVMDARGRNFTLASGVLSNFPINHNSTDTR